MLNKAKTLNGYKLHCLDGEIGEVNEFYFDDQHWAIRYLIADTGGWLTGRQVLISPHALAGVNRDERYISVNLTKKQIENSPSLGSGKPVSRQFENSYYGYYGWPAYWGGPYMWGPYPYILQDRKKWAGSVPEEGAEGFQLRSTYEVNGFSILAADGEIGFVEDLIIDDANWAIRYLIIDIRNWWPGKKVLGSPEWIESVSWEESKAFTSLFRETIKQSPEYMVEAMPAWYYDL